MRDCNARQRALDARIKGAQIFPRERRKGKILEIRFCVLYAYEESIEDSEDRVEAARLIHNLEISRSFSQSVVEITFYVASSFRLFRVRTSITLL